MWLARPVESANAFHLIDFGAAAYCILLSNFNNLPAVEGEVFVVGDVAELVAEAVLMSKCICNHADFPADTLTVDNYFNGVVDIQ